MGSGDFLLVSGLTAALVGVVLYAILRFRALARGAREPVRSIEGADAIMASAVHEAVSRLRDQGRELRARAEASERLSDRIVASLPSGLLLVASDGRVVTINPAGCRLLGIADGAHGHIADVLSAWPGLQAVIEQALADARPVPRQTVRGMREGRTVSLGSTVAPILRRDGALESIVCLFEDVTALLALEEQLRLKDSLARVGELTAGIAHEFRNGLATIHGYARLMDPTHLPSDYGPYLQAIRQETQALGEVVSNFLNFARPSRLTLTHVNLQSVIARVVDDLRTDAAAEGGRIEMTGDFPGIEGDEVLLRQAFANLVRNAIEACTTSGRPPSITVDGRVDLASHCRVSVSDNGPGIDATALDRIFQPFFTTRSNGTGLGLALVQKICVTHNGHVTANNGAAGGALFEVTLPLKQDAA
ncbi:MAG: nitrogen regulation protein NR(II) [Vicinamibacterales bacterium]